MLTALDTLIDPFDSRDSPGGVVAVARGGVGFYTRAFGMADLADPRVNSGSTPFPAGSICKQFTCAAVLLLEQDGRLSRGDSLGRWLPELPSAHRDVTLVQLMRHQGGVRCYLDHWMFNGYRTMPAGLPWRIQSRQSVLNFTPGTRSAYSNGGYLLLTAVVERAAGINFADFVQERLLRPCAMTSSRIGSQDLSGRQARAHQRLAGGWTPATALTEDAFGDGGLVATADDLLRWTRALRQGGPVSLAQLAAFEEPRGMGPSDYRFGVISQDWRGVRLIQHAGGMPGANSSLLMLPDHDLDIAVLFNRPAPATTIAMKIAETLLGDILLPEPEPPAASDFPDLLGSWHAREEGFLFAFQDVDDVLNLSLFGDAPFPLDRWPGDAEALPFWADAGAAQLRFRRTSDPDAIEYYDGVAWSPASRLAPPARPVLEPPAGIAFRSGDADAILRFETDGIGSIVRIDGRSDRSRFRAEEVAPGLFRFRPDLFPAGKAARLLGEGDGVRTVRISTQRTYAIDFDRTDDSTAETTE